MEKFHHEYSGSASSLGQEDDTVCPPTEDERLRRFDSHSVCDPEDANHDDCNTASAIALGHQSDGQEMVVQDANGEGLGLDPGQVGQQAPDEAGSNFDDSSSNSSSDQGLPQELETFLKAAPEEGMPDSDVSSSDSSAGEELPKDLSGDWRMLYRRIESSQLSNIQELNTFHNEAQVGHEVAEQDMSDSDVSSSNSSSDGGLSGGYMPESDDPSSDSSSDEQLSQDMGGDWRKLIEHGLLSSFQELNTFHDHIQDGMGAEHCEHDETWASLLNQRQLIENGVLNTLEDIAAEE